MWEQQHASSCKNTISISISLKYCSCTYVSSKEQWLVKCTLKYERKSSCTSWKKRYAITCLSIKMKCNRTEILNFHNWNFSSKWIGTGSPFRWPYLSSNLTPLDFFFWNVHKELYLRSKVPHYFFGNLAGRKNTPAARPTPANLRKFVDLNTDKIRFRVLAVTSLNIWKSLSVPRSEYQPDLTAYWNTYILYYCPSYVFNNKCITLNVVSIIWSFCIPSHL